MIGLAVRGSRVHNAGSYWPFCQKPLVSLVGHWNLGRMPRFPWTFFSLSRRFVLYPSEWEVPFIPTGRVTRSCWLDRSVDDCAE